MAGSKKFPVYRFGVGLRAVQPDSPPHSEPHATFHRPPGLLDDLSPWRRAIIRRLLFDRSLLMKAPYGLTAVIELVAGMALLTDPSATAVIPVGTPLEGPATLTMARVGGAGLLSLGVACWFARGDALSSAARGLVAAMLLYDIAAATLLGFAGIRFGLHGVALWPAVILHAMMAIWCVAWLRQNSPS